MHNEKYSTIGRTSDFLLDLHMHLAHCPSQFYLLVWGDQVYQIKAKVPLRLEFCQFLIRILQTSNTNIFCELMEFVQSRIKTKHLYLELLFQITDWILSGDGLSFCSNGTAQSILGFMLTPEARGAGYTKLICYCGSSWTPSCHHHHLHRGHCHRRRLLRHWWS